MHFLPLSPIVSPMKSALGKILVHPMVLALLNFAILLLAYSSLRTTWFDAASGMNHIHSAIELWEGFGTIVLGFGVALEERETLKKIFKITPASDGVDELAHDFGVIFVMLGVMIEVLAWLVKIPNEVLNTENIEGFFLNTAAVVACVVVVLQLRFLYHLVRK